MIIITKKIKAYIQQKNISQNEFGRRIELPSGALSSMLSGDAPFPEDKIEKIAPILGVSPETIKGWIIADKYPKNTLKKILQAKKQAPENNKPIFSTWVYGLRDAGNYNMEDFAAAIGYNQGMLSQVLLGKEPVSHNLIQKLSAYSGVPEDEIKIWTIADKYSLEALQTAVDL